MIFQSNDICTLQEDGDSGSGSNDDEDALDDAEN